MWRHRGGGDTRGNSCPFLNFSFDLLSFDIGKRYNESDWGPPAVDDSLDCFRRPRGHLEGGGSRIDVGEHYCGLEVIGDQLCSVPS